MGKNTGICRISLALAAALLMALPLSCSDDEHPLKDGYYMAEAMEFDEFGWKEYVTICVSSGRIILVEYDAYNKSGFAKTWDMSYMRGMDAVKGVYPSAYSRYYGERLMRRQGTDDISHISGATYSYHVFMQLAEAVMENARQGNTDTSQVRINGSSK